MKTNTRKSRVEKSSVKNDELGQVENQNEHDSMMDSALHELFLNELKDIYWAEKQLTKDLPKVIRKVTSHELQVAIESHLRETEGQVTRLEEIFKNLGEKPQAKKCDAMEGLSKEMDVLIEQTEDGTLVRDVAIISGAQKIEHYEIATYGTLRTLASVMGHSQVQEWLTATLEEEKNADSTLTRIAESFVNEHAKEERR
jgi:ferritin-like metal-binding protein YciE